jgi:hypothetical protein
VRLQGPQSLAHFVVNRSELLITNLRLIPDVVKALNDRRRSRLVDGTPGQAVINHFLENGSKDFAKG